MRWIFVCALFTVAAACDAPAEGPDAGAADAGPEPGQGSLARGALAINEVAPRPLAERPGDPDPADWIELVNRSDSDVDLCGYFVTDDLGRLDHYLALGGVAPPAPCPPRLLAPGAYVVIDADDDVAAGPDHAPFRLGTADEVHIVTTTGLTEDSLLFLYPLDVEGPSLARAPDGDGLFFLAAPTPGAPNPLEAP